MHPAVERLRAGAQRWFVKENPRDVYRSRESETPDLPVDYAKLEAAAEEALSSGVFGYVAGGAYLDRSVLVEAER